MDLADLTAYAEQKYNLKEQRKWESVLGVSVLADPRSGKWLALLMRQRDSQTGAEVQCCDIKCGPRSRSESAASFVTAPIRMKGSDWAGIVFDDRTEPEVVFRLFDSAVRIAGLLVSNAGAASIGTKSDNTIILEDLADRGDGAYGDTALPFAGEIGSEERGGLRLEAGRRLSQVGYAGWGQGSASRSRPEYGHSRLFGAEAESQSWDFYVPDKITEMIGLYEYGDGSFAQKCRNFYRQGKFMEDYEDGFVGNVFCRQFYPTYHDLNIQQLRCYFSWRTALRQGEFRPVFLSFAYIYLYELLCGIGARSPQESLAKMREFDAGFLDAGLGDAGMRKNLRRWMFEFALLHDLPVETARQYADPALAENDLCLAVLKNSQAHSDDEVFSALCRVADKKFPQSPAVAQDAARGRHLFAAVWRYASANYSRDGQDLFALCFGQRRAFERHLLENAVHWEEGAQPDREYELNECRSYCCRDGRWYLVAYDCLCANEVFQAFIHETDRLLRKHLKTGHALRRKAEEAWVTPYVEAVLEAEKRAEAEAARPKVTINFAGLEQIRREAQVTEESLLTAEELGDLGGADAGELGRAGAEGADNLDAYHSAGVPAERMVPAEELGGADAERAVGLDADRSAEFAAERGETVEDSTVMARAAVAEDTAAEIATIVAVSAAGENAEPGLEAGISGIALDAVHGQILAALLNGQSVDILIKQHRLMASLVAETINAAFYDEIGDSVVETEGDTLTLVDDYREDILRLWGDSRR